MDFIQKQIEESISTKQQFLDNPELMQNIEQAAQLCLE